MTPSNQKKSKPQKLEVGIDFTIENGLYVFTSAYLLRRGYCCENACRNCPYGFKKGQDLGQTKR